MAVLALVFLAAIPAMADDDPRQALVRVFVETSHPDPLAPWTHARPRIGTGSGVILEGERILTNAHVVQDAVQIEVQREGTASRVPARVLFVSEDCDLALITTDDASFFDGVTPLGVGSLPDAHDDVAVLGYPVGGDLLSVTAGVVSRREHHHTALTGIEILLVQIDAAINPGNSGGPVLSGYELVGIATQTRRDAERIGHMVPAPIIDHFLQDVEDGQVDGLPTLGIPFQPLTHPALRRALGMAEGQTGIRFIGSRDDYCYNEFLPGDVLLELDGHVIEEDGRVTLGNGLRVSFEHLVQRRQAGELVDAKLLRDGELREREIRMRTSYFGDDGTDERGDYVIVGGLVLQPLSWEFLEAVEDLDAEAAQDLRAEAARTRARREDHGLVVISRVLSHPVNRGYGWATGAIVDTINGKQVSWFFTVPCDLEYGEQTIEITTTQGELIVLDREEAAAATDEVLETYGVPRRRGREAGE